MPDYHIGHAPDAGGDGTWAKVPICMIFFGSPEFRPHLNPSLPQSLGEIASSLCSPRGSIMGTTLDHRRCAEECVAMARRAEDNQDKALWLTLAQSWVRLAEHVERTTLAAEMEDEMQNERAS